MFNLTLAQGVDLELVRIPAGEFWMGSDIWSYNEKPKHRLSLPEYWMGKYLVTIAQYAAFIRVTGYETRPLQVDDLLRTPTYPVVFVTWYDARAFCRWVDESLLVGIEGFAGCQARLPGEAEWEKAARGADGRAFPWGEEQPDETRCNFNWNVKKTSPRWGIIARWETAPLAALIWRETSGNGPIAFSSPIPTTRRMDGKTKKIAVSGWCAAGRPTATPTSCAAPTVLPTHRISS